MIDPRPALGLRPVINAAGTETSWGAGLAIPEAIAAVAAILPYSVDMADLQRVASRAISTAFGTEAGCVTASAAAGVTLAVAACLTSTDVAAIAALPHLRGPRRHVVMQAGHMIDYGAPVAQAVRLAGAEVRVIGAVTGTSAWELEAALDAETAAVLHVISHHCCRVGELALPEVLRVAAARRVPVILDAASEETMLPAPAADLVVVSAHKFLGGPTAGIVAGRTALVRAVLLQNRGIGRGFKVGKEGITGTIAALRAWTPEAKAARLAMSRRAVAAWQAAFADIPSLHAAPSPDPTGNAVVRLRLSLAPDATFAAWELAHALADGTPPVAVRCPEADRGYIELDPMTLREGEADAVAAAVRRATAALAAPGRPRTTFESWRDAALAVALRWPD